MSVQVTVEPMRNEHSVSFLLDKTLIPPGTGESYPNSEKAQANPLAKALFELKGVNSIWILGNEVQVTKDDDASWGALKGRVVETIRKNA